MASPTVVDDDDEKPPFSSESKEIVSEDVEEALTSSKSKPSKSAQDSYDSDSGDSDCSVTSGFNDRIFRRISLFMNTRAGHSTAVESGETTWTDEKHSSYLDSMEATFVQKMYDKEYCSLDVCGHSSHSSLTLDQDCVESQPFCLNMRKPLERKVAGLLTFRAPSRPLAVVPSMLTSPWIQHFKSQRDVSLRNARFQDKDARPSHAKDISKKDSVNNACSGSSEHAPQSSYESAYKKRDFAIVTQAGVIKKRKCQHFAPSHMDILMEQQYNLEQHRKIGESKGSEDGQEERKEHLAEQSEHHKEAVLSCKKVALLEDSVLKEKQDLAKSTDIELPPIVVNGRAFTRKPDQVVPSFESVAEEACVKTKSADLLGDDDEDVHCATMSEPECVSTRSGSKTWTWGIQGPRYHVVMPTAAQPFHS